MIKLIFNISRLALKIVVMALGKRQDLSVSDLSNAGRPTIVKIVKLLTKYVF
jgi:hypothetical protein